ncbi:MAG: restriction endonuclease subunit S [Treponema sp.]|uniref:restriction endonuclease subunit S n=1 Tax=Treponema sp. TaxID=166 RepID=UPI00298EA752|nr:restriction endonuclease subunit S [Treponema sp.]MCQ2601285.1 restriction endonuclease subunit S [Treponema sp.]
MNKVKLADVAIESRESLKTKDRTLPVVGLEHIIPEQINLTEWDVGVDNTFTKLFKKNDVLFGRRRAYLKKAAVAPCEGICSGDITVIRAKEDKILPELLPFVIQNDIFFDYAVGKSAGSLSPRVKWEHLAKYEFILPSLSEQKKLAETLWSIVATMESYKKLLAKTDEMVKAKFVEMFGDAILNSKKIKTKKIGEFSDCIAGATPSTKIKEYWENGNIPWMSSGEVHNGRIYDTLEKITQKGYDNCSTKLIRPHSVVIALAGQGKTRGTVAVIENSVCTNQSLCAIVQNQEILDTDFLYYQLKFRYQELRQLSGVAEGRGGLNLKNIQGINALIPEMENQISFVNFAKKSEESKSAIQASLDTLTQVYKKIIAENLGGNINAN